MDIEYVDIVKDSSIFSQLANNNDTPHLNVIRRQ